MRTVQGPETDAEALLLTEKEIVLVYDRYLYYQFIHDTDDQWVRVKLIGSEDRRKRLFPPVWRFAYDTPTHLLLTNSRRHYLVQKTTPEWNVVSRTRKTAVLPYHPGQAGVHPAGAVRPPGSGIVQPVHPEEDDNFKSMIESDTRCRLLAVRWPLVESAAEAPVLTREGVPDMRFIENVRLFMVDPTLRADGTPNTQYRNYVPDEMYMWMVPPLVDTNGHVTVRVNNPPETEQEEQPDNTLQPTGLNPDMRFVENRPDILALYRRRLRQDISRGRRRFHDEAAERFHVGPVEGDEDEPAPDIFPEVSRTLVVESGGSSKSLMFLPETEEFVRVAVSPDGLLAAGYTNTGRIVLVDVD